jgi:ADP-ribose pyrophosphatase
MEPLYAFYSSPGFSNERIWLFLATGLSPGTQNVESDELIEIVKIPLERALEMVAAGEICDGKSILGLVAASARRDRPWDRDPHGLMGCTHSLERRS